MRTSVLVGLVATTALALCAGARGAPAGRVTPPPPHAGFSYQLGGVFAAPPSAGVVERDRGAAPMPGRYGVCYVNAFQAQKAEHAWWRAHHRNLLLAHGGREVVDRGWDEVLLDTSTAAKRRALTAVVGAWIDGCARVGYRAVEPDNLDSWTRSQSLLTRADNLAFAALFIARAHADELAIAQKNAAEVSAQGKRLGFDFAIAEECQPYGECGAYLRAYGREVIEIEYADHGGAANFAAACRARGADISIVKRDRDVVPAGRPGFLERSCAAATTH